MRFARITACFFLLLLAFPLHAQTKKITVLGTLTRVMAIGAETSGWSIELNPVLTIDGHQLSSLEVKSSDPKKLEKLENQTVKATGKLTYTTGVETGQRPILNLSSIKLVKEKSTKEK